MSKKTTVVFIRHGQTDWNAEGRWQGQLDIPLNETGRHQARAVARRLQRWPLAVLYCSDLRRAADTAAVIGQAAGLTPIPDARWRERHFGDFQGKTGRERREHFPEVAASFSDDISSAPPGGESLPEMHERVNEALADLLANHPDETVGVVAHGGTIRVVVREVLGLPLHQRPNFTVSGNSGLTVIEDGGAWRRLLLLNDTAHLEPWSG